MIPFWYLKTTLFHDLQVDLVDYLICFYWP